MFSATRTLLPCGPASSLFLHVGDFVTAEMGAATIQSPQLGFQVCGLLTKRRNSCPATTLLETVTSHLFLFV